MSDESIVLANSAGDSAAINNEQQKQKQQQLLSTPAAMLLQCSYLAQRADPRLKSLLLWTDARMSLAALTGTLIVLWALATRSLISVLAYAGLAALMTACALRIYHYVPSRRQQQQPTSVSNEHDEIDERKTSSDASLPLCWLLRAPVRLPREQLLNFLDRRLAGLESLANYFLCLMLCRDPIRTLKMFFCLIFLTYIGAWMNATTLAAVVTLAAFSLPKLYSMKHAEVDAGLASLLDRYHFIYARIWAAIPFGDKQKVN